MDVSTGYRLCLGAGYYSVTRPVRKERKKKNRCHLCGGPRRWSKRAQEFICLPCRGKHEARTFPGP